MREIVHLQAGQCGNQIGAKVSASQTVSPAMEFVGGRFSKKLFVGFMLGSQPCISINFLLLSRPAYFCFSIIELYQGFFLPLDDFFLSSFKRKLIYFKCRFFCYSFFVFRENILSKFI